jgi:Lar family restriction alleviation protein
MTELKPCPFCGGIAQVMHYKNAFGKEYSYVECTVCKCESANFMIAAYHCSDDLAVEAWNKRVSDGDAERRQDG